MTDTVHRFAIDAATDGKFYLLFNRSRHANGLAFAASRDPTPFDSEADVRSYGRRSLGAADEDFADAPGMP